MTNELLATEPSDAPPPEPHLVHATFAAGCFWGLQHAMQALPGVVRARSGFTAGQPLRNGRLPTYAVVSSGKSGFAEAVRVAYDPTLIPYSALLETWWAQLEDPTDGTGAGNNRGLQYRPLICWHTEAQRAEAAAFLEREAKALHLPDAAALAVKLWPATAFTEAEEVHQDYISKGGLDSEPEVPYWMGSFVDEV